MSFSQVMRHDFPEEVPRPGRLAALRERIRHIEQPASHGVLPLGVAAIDRVLPDGGLALGAVHEILGIDGDEEDGAAACGFIAGLLARLRMGSVLWCLKRPDLYGPGLLAHGLDPARLVIVTVPRDEDILWAIEEGLRAPVLSRSSARSGDCRSWRAAACNLPPSAPASPLFCCGAGAIARRRRANASGRARP